MLSRRQYVGFAGVVVTSLGVFLPILRVPILGSLNYFQNGRGDGVIVLLLALVSALLIHRRAYNWLWASGLASLGVLAFSLSNLFSGLSSARAEMREGMEGNPFAALGELAAQSVQLEWGWIPLGAGVTLILIAAAWSGGESEEDSPPESSPNTNSPARPLPTIAAIALALIVGFVAGRAYEQRASPFTSSTRGAGPISSGESTPVGPGSEVGNSDSGEPATKWEVTESTDPLDDSRTVVLRLESDEGLSSMLREPIVLILRCQSDRTEAYIVWDDYLGEEAEVTSRIGDTNPVTQNWNMSTDRQATFFPADSIAFIKFLMDAESFVARVTPYNQSPVTAIFDVRGLGEAIRPLREACNW